MNSSSKSLLVLAALAILVATAALWWWYSLVEASASACVSPVVAPGVECDHSAQLFIALGAAAIAAITLVAVAVRAKRNKVTLASET
mgnify:CR=1 FL=1